MSRRARYSQFTPSGLIMDLDLTRQTIVGPRDRSLGANHGTAYGNVAGSFDGVADNVLIEEALITQFPFTVSGRFNTSSATQQTVFWCGDKDVSADWFALEVNAAAGIVVHLLDGATANEVYSVTLNDGVNHHLAVTMYVDGASVKADVYVDGTFGTTLSDVIWQPAYWSDIAADRTAIGRRMDVSPSTSFNGNLWDWHIYDGYKATAADATRLYRGFALSAASGAADPTARWRHVVDGVDHSGNGKALTINGVSSDVGANGGQSGAATRAVMDFVAANNDSAAVEQAAISDFPFTVSGRFNTSSSAGQAMCWLGDKGAGADYFAVYTQSGNLYVRFADGTAPTEFVSASYDDGEDHHVSVIAYTSGSSVYAAVYIDGALVDTLTNASWATAFWSDISADRTALGRFMDASASTPFDGNLWDWRVHDVKLTAADIFELYHGREIATAPVAYWKLEGDLTDETGTYDLAGGVGGSGTPDVVYGPYDVARQDQFVGGAMSFDGTNDYVEVADKAANRFGTGDFQIHVWAKVAAGQVQGAPALLGKGDTGAGEWEFFFDDGLLWFYGDAGGINAKSAGTDYRDDTWHLFSALRNGTDLSVLADGVSVVTDASSGNDLNTTKAIQVGCADSAAVRYFTGQIRRPRIATASKTIAQGTLDALALYAQGKDR